MTKIWKSISTRGEERIRGGRSFHYALLEKSLNMFCAASSSRVVFAFKHMHFSAQSLPVFVPEHDSEEQGQYCSH